MAKKLIIVESPSKAKTIKGYLGRGFSVMASNGHVRDLPKSQLGVDVEHNYEPKYITIRGKGDLLSKLKKEAKEADKIYLATDPDREGEAISWHLANALNIDVKDKCRITFNEITKKAVTTAVKEPRQINLNLVDAQQARRILDRIVGYKLSPLLWRKIKKGLSAGRVQSTATKLIVDREREIEKFIPEEYWSLAADLKDSKGKNPFSARFYGKNGKKQTIKSEDEMNLVLADLKGAEYTTESVKYGKKKKNPAPPFITSTLQQEASRKLGFTAKRTMTAAQMLYEGVEVKGYGTLGLITYMRTDSLRIADEAMSAAESFIKNNYGTEYLPEKPRHFKSRKSAQDAHEAIRPSTPEITPDKIKDTVPADQYKLYKLIWERFMASQMASSLYDTVSADIKANDYIFKASGSKICFKGFELLYVSENDDDSVKKIPMLTEGEKLQCSELKPEQHFTEPPARYSEASLIKTLEEMGIGRPSTYAPIITTIMARGYVVREKKLLKPTELGIVTTDLMNEYFSDIINVEFTAGLEEKLDEIEEGEADWHQTIDDFYHPFETLLEKADNAIGKVKIEDEVSDVKCDKCGRMMVYKMGRFGKFLACPGFPECRNTKAIIKYTGVLCPRCGAKIVERKSQRGKKYYACERGSECGFVLWDKPVNKKCEKCGCLMVEKYYKNGKKIVCSNKDCK